MLALVALWIALQEMGVLPQNFLASTPQSKYAVSLVCIVTAVGGSLAACSLLSSKRAKSDIDANPAALEKWQWWRLALNAVAIVPSALLYYAGAFDRTPLYCMLLGVAAALICVPKNRS